MTTDEGGVVNGWCVEDERLVPLSDRSPTQIEALVDALSNNSTLDEIAAAIDNSK